MKKTIDDKFFCTIISCESNMTADRLVCYLYIFQLAGFDLNFRYKWTSHGIASRDIDSYFNLLSGYGLIQVNRNGTVSLLNGALDDVDSMAITYEDLELVNSLLSFLNRLSYNEVLFLCLVDIIIKDYFNHPKKSADDLLKDEIKIKNTLASLSSEYSDDNFYFALKFRRELGSLDLSILGGS